jgi:phage terminase large subunit-like protein
MRLSNWLRGCYSWVLMFGFIDQYIWFEARIEEDVSLENVDMDDKFWIILLKAQPLKVVHVEINL